MADLADPGPQEPQRPAPHGTPFLVRDEESTRVPGHLVGPYEGGGVEPFREPLVDVGGVRGEAVARVAGGAVDGLDGDGRQPQQPLGGADGGGEFVAPPLVESAEQSFGERVGPPVLLLDLGAAGRRELRDP
nr:hypothetical protein [Streptomyces sp. RPA4-2]